MSRFSRGQKVDLATFQASGGPSDLPSGPRDSSSNHGGYDDTRDRPRRTEPVSGDSWARGQTVTSSDSSFRGGGGGGDRGDRSARDVPDPDDKWSKVFGSGTNATNARKMETGRGGFGGDRSGGFRDGGDRSGGFRDGGDRSGGFRDGGDRGGGFRDRDRDSSFRGSSGSGDFRRNTGRRDDETNDPRFAMFNKGGRGGGGGGGSGGGRYDSTPTSSVLPTGPGGSSSTQAALDTLQADKAAIEEKKRADAQAKAEADKAAKAAKAAARLENEAKARQAKEAAAAAAAAEAQAVRDALERGKALVGTAVSSGLKGDELKAHLEQGSEKPTAAAFVSGVLSTLTWTSAVGASLKWCTDAEYGSAIKYLLGPKPSARDRVAVQQNKQNQLAVVFAVQGYCYEENFPRVEIKGQTKKVIALLLQTLYNAEIVEEDVFLAWADSDDDSVKGKTNAVVQTTEFIAMLREREDEEVDEDEEIDAPRETVA